MSAVAFSLVASIVLTIALNVAVRVFPGTARRAQEAVVRRAARSTDDQPRDSNVRIYVPWKAMLIGSLLLTLLINAVLLARP